MCILLGILLLVIYSLSDVPDAVGHKVPVHDVITSSAVARSENLQQFLDDFALRTVELPFELSEILSYRSSETFADNDKRMYKNTATSLIRFGSVMEDLGVRPLQHFYAPTENRSGTGLQRAPCAADARSWAFDDLTYGYIMPRDEVPLSAFTPACHLESARLLPNEFSYPRALDWYVRSLTGGCDMLGIVCDQTNKEAALGEMFYALGQVIHLIQDMSQPSHIRDDEHGGHFKGGFSQLEEWGGIHLDEIARFSAQASLQPPWYSSSEQYLTELALFSAANFFSDDTATEYNPSCANSNACDYPPDWTVLDSVGHFLIQSMSFVMANLLCISRIVVSIWL